MKPSGMRLPPTDCWPTHAIICEMLTKEPLEPHVAIVSGGLRKWSSVLQTSPASVRMLESSPLMNDSRVCSAEQPGEGSRVPRSKSSILCWQRAVPSLMSAAFCRSRSAVGITSPTPMEKPRSHRKRAACLAMRDMQRAAAAAPWSRSRMAKSPFFCPSPSQALSMTPHSSSDSWKHT